MKFGAEQELLAAAISNDGYGLEVIDVASLMSGVTQRDRDEGEDYAEDEGDEDAYDACVIFSVEHQLDGHEDDEQVLAPDRVRKIHFDIQ